MARNDIPTNSAQLIGLGQKNYDGILKVGASVPVTMVTAAQLLAELNAFIAADGDFNAGRSARQDASGLFQTKMEAVYDWLLAVSNMLATPFGTRWSTAWAQAGFINNSTAIPSKIEERLGLALSLVTFFTKNPGYEVPTMNLTAARGTTLRDAAVAAQTAVTNAGVAMTTLGDAWQAAYEALTGSMRELVKNLEGKLGKFDPRWKAFGLNMPGAKSTPGQPQNVTASLDETGALVLQCDAEALATRYRWRGRIVGVQTEYELLASTAAPLASLREVAAGQTMEIIVQAVNGTLQGVASEPITFTMPGAKSAGFRNLSATEEAPALSENSTGNGSGNGNGRGNGHVRHAHPV